jgi:small subunit ribosomal protein S7
MRIHGQRFFYSMFKTPLRQTIRQLTTRQVLKQTEPLQEQFVNHIMKDGKKTVARRLLSDCLDHLQQKKQQNPIALLQEAIELVSPLVGLKGEKRGMKQVQTPIPLTDRQRQRVGIQWVVKEAEKSRKHPFGVRLGMELCAILDGTSVLLNRKTQVHKQALSNRSNLILQDRKIRSF